MWEGGSPAGPWPAGARNCPSCSSAVWMGSAWSRMGVSGEAIPAIVCLPADHSRALPLTPLTEKPPEPAAQARVFHDLARAAGSEASRLFLQLQGLREPTSISGHGTPVPISRADS